MNSISFTFAAESSEADRTIALREIEQWPGIKAAGFIKANSKSPAVRRMGMLMLDPSGVVPEVMARLRASPLIEQASIPARRGL